MQFCCLYVKFTSGVGVVGSFSKFIIIFISLGLSFLGPALATSVDSSVLEALKKNQEVEILGTFIDNVDSADIEKLKVSTKTKTQKLAGIRAKPMWITHGFSAKITKESLSELIKNREVKSIFLNESLVFDNLLRAQPIEAPAQYFSENIKLNILNAYYPEVTGAGIRVGVIDTGVDGDHDFLKGKIKLFYDSDRKVITIPTDYSGHGTHVTGILLQVAPECEIISVQIHDIKTAFQAMEYLTNPDGNIRTRDWPLVVNNSWGLDKLPNIELYYRALRIWDKLGIIAVFSAGNKGHLKNAISSPKNFPSTIVVAATDENRNATMNSSRGPVIFKDRPLLKPEISAPGENIYSTLPGNIWGVWSGTSMAAPFVTATIALISQANPSLTPKQKREILIDSAFTRKYSWDPGLGYGELDILESVRRALPPGF